ncbi:uncharacterized protein TRUGW13939_06664 [Talaromyces rugulosus]|uniref:GPR1/FUN34/YaaH-class plasma membrane protein n=1 Tax=Talaromyces rugulosus TaxID=121627 RepID=A0A7H8QZK5_TALRU|nr:uncharacterized protein TRUGW13939_06664 [Talaromyces rugulosus]QKX59530.1 hypothetical protein TRUGW13939_06664 [Talaromyces rugulosus]
MSTLSHIKSHDVSEMDRVQTAASVTIPSELFEKMYLNPETSVKGQLRKTLGNPTPVGLMGLIINASGLGCNLMGWGGSGGGGAALVGVSYIFGGVLLTLGFIMEWILGNSFVAIVFAFFGAYTFTFALTLTPSVNAQGAFTASATTPAELAAGQAEFNASIAFFYIFSAVMIFIFMICSLRTNIPFFMIFLLLGLLNVLLACADWEAAKGHMGVSENLQVASGAVAFALSFPAWYIWTAQLFLTVDFPLSLPIGDLSTRFRGASDRKSSQKEVV